MSSNPFEHLGGSPLPSSLNLTNEQAWLMKDLAQTTSALNEELAQRTSAARLVEADIRNQMVPLSAIDYGLAEHARTMTSAADFFNTSKLAEQYGAGSSFSDYAKELLSGQNMADYAARQLGYTVADAWAKQNDYLRDALAGTLAIPDFHTLADSLSISALTDSYRLSALTADEWARTQAKALDDYTQQLTAGSGFASAHALFGAGSGADFGAQLTEQLNQFLPKGYADQLKGVIGGIDFEAIRTASEAAATRVYDAYRDRDTEDFDGIVDAVRRTDLTDVREVITSVVAAAFQDARDRGELRGSPSPWVLLLVAALLNLLISSAQTIATPMVQRLYEKANPPTAPAPKHAVKHARKHGRCLTAAAAPDGPLPTERAQRRSRHSWTSPTVSVGLKFSANQERTPSSTVVVSLRTLTLYRGPDTKQRTQGTIEAGQILGQLRAKRGWVFVRYADPLGEGSFVGGWVRAKYVRPLEVETRRLILCALDDAAASGHPCE